MKIGIITFHRAHNYGALLQAYAMQTFLNENGHEAYMVDYRNKVLEEQYKLFSYRFYLGVGIKAPAHLVNRILTFFLRIERRRNYKQFMESFLNLKDDANFDALIFGSDQIWNPSVTGGFDENYWGNIYPKSKSLRIAYAPSIEAGVLDIYADNVRNALKRFDAISVREVDMINNIKKYTDKKISLVCDPTFLIKKESYERLLKPIKVKGEFVAIYQVNKNSLTYQVAKHLAKRDGLKIVELGQNTSFLHLCRYKNTAGPSEFLWIIKNAKYVVTSSFHGTALSIIMQKQFFVTTMGKGEKRMKNLLEIAGLNDRLITNVISSDTLLPIDYNKPLGSLDKYIRSSQEFIKKSLQKNV